MRGMGTPLHNTTVGTNSNESGRSASVYAEGTIDVAPSAKSIAAHTPVLFVMIKAAVAGPPLAVKRVDRPVFPFSFSITEADSMAGGGFFDGNVNLIARLDQDGMAGPKQPGDLETILEIKKGSSRRVSVLIGTP